MSSGFYRGVSINQDVRYSDKEKKLLKTMKFEQTLETKIDLKRINIDVIKPWIAAKINSLLGIEDDVVTEYVFTQLEEKNLNPKVMQINLTGFLNARRAREFMDELWQLLVEAQNSPDGIPVSMINKKMEELKTSGVRRDVPMAKATENDWKNRYQSLTGGRYGKDEPNYTSLPGAADEINAEPESPSNRRWRRERTPDNLPIPRRRRIHEEDDHRAERGRDSNRHPRRSRSRENDNRRSRRDRSREEDDHRAERGRGDGRHSKRDRSHERNSRGRKRSDSPPRRRRTPSPPSRPRRFVEERSSPCPESPKAKSSESPPAPSKDSEKKRKRRDSADSDTERKHKKSKKEKKSKKDKRDRD